MSDKSALTSGLVSNLDPLSTSQPKVTQPGTIAAYLEQKTSSGELIADKAQMAIAQQMDRLNAELANIRLARKTSALGWLFAKKIKSTQSPKGLYLYGGVGRGKTMLMDQFYALCPMQRKRRVHFNDFMADIQDRINAHRQALKEGKTTENDPIPPVARDVIAQSRLLCFDEFSVTDIADAMILSRLFSALFAQGAILVATSNVKPSELYRDGLNRDLFLPFIDVLKTHTTVTALDSPPDYRQTKLDQLPVYHTPLGPETDAAMSAAFNQATSGLPITKRRIRVMGRTISVEQEARNIARFTFDELCNKPLAARDYLALTEHYNTFFIEGVPKMERAEQNQAKRFILLIDTLYDAGAKLVLSADGEPDELYQATSGTVAFEFARTASRLTEMRSADYAHSRNLQN